MPPEKVSGWRRAVRFLRQRGPVYLRWLRRDFFRNPRFELYARWVGEIDRAAFLAERAQGAEAIRTRHAPFTAEPIPQIIWMYWHQGEAQAPFVVRRCIESWRQHNPDWDLRVLDADSVTSYADMTDVPASLPFRYHADMLRLRLLKDHGGVWADATVYCHRPLADWIPLHLMSGFFLLRNPGPGRLMSSWFMAGQPRHILPVLWEDSFRRYVRGLRHVPDLYFVFFYLFQWQLRRDLQAKAAFDQMAGLPAIPSFAMMEALSGRLDAPHLSALVAAGLPVSKLSWKEIVDEDAFDGFCALIPCIKRV